MTKVLANIVSAILHPLLMPTIGLIFILSSATNIILLPYEAKKIILIIVAINTFALPLLIIPLFYRLNIIKSIQMEGHRERIIPLAFTIIPYIFSFYFLNRLPIINEIPYFLLGATITIFISLVVSFWWKISIHMIGIGGMAGLFFALSLRFSVEVIWFLVGAVLLAGIVAWARLALNAHKPLQVYSGFLVGWITVSLTIIML
jgi:membrane-associated phospholipid phosphatase